MARYVVKRILSIIPVLFFVAVLSFLIIHLTPGDPASVMLGDQATPADIERLREQLGLNVPIYEQFLNYFIRLLHGDFGWSIFMKMPVTQAFFEHLPPTLGLTIFAQVIAIIIAIPLGILAATKKGSWADFTVMGGVLLGVSVPTFWIGILLIMLFAVKLNLLPAGGYYPISSGFWNYFRALILPGFTLGFAQAALIARMTRNSMLEVFSQNYIRTAKAKGVKRLTILYKHALRNAFIPIITTIGLSLAVLLSGATVTEVVFNIPGIGQLIVNSVLRRDYTVIQGSILMITTIFVVVNLIVDILYFFINPNIKFENKS
ncbi:MAG: ABC transporter permease [Desulfitobacteriaceae bacterium]